MNVETAGYILSGGFAKGYRTYIMAGVAVIGSLAGYAVGDMNLTQVITAVAGSVGLGTLRAANTPPAA